MALYFDAILCVAWWMHARDCPEKTQYMQRANKPYALHSWMEHVGLHAPAAVDHVHYIGFLCLERFSCVVEGRVLMLFEHRPVVQ